MNGRCYKVLVGLMWLGLLSTALNYWRNWDRLPVRMAVHFDANWQPNGYSSREGALTLGLGIMAFVLLVFTITALILNSQKPTAAWPMLAVFYLALGILWYANNWIVQRNLNEQPVHSEWMDPSSPAIQDLRRTRFLTLHS